MASSIRLRTTQYRKWAKAMRWANNQEAAAAIGVDPNTLYRILTGRTSPSTRFIAGLLRALLMCEFDDLFEVTDDAEDLAS